MTFISMVLRKASFSLYTIVLGLGGLHMIWLDDYRFTPSFLGCLLTSLLVPYIYSFIRFSLNI